MKRLLEWFAPFEQQPHNKIKTVNLFILYTKLIALKVIRQREAVNRLTDLHPNPDISRVDPAVIVDQGIG